MTFSLTTLFVVPTGNTLPTTGSTQNLTAKQFGIFMPDYTPATVGTIGTSKYFYCVQGRATYAPGEATKKSDQIPTAQTKIIEWYKASGQLNSSFQITEISGMSVGCNEDVTVTLNLHSMYIDTAYFNGLTRSVMETTPCCNCGSNPCDTLTAAQIQTLMQDLATDINNDILLNQFVIASTTGTGATTNILISGIPLNEYGLPCDLTAFPYQFDRMYFWTFVRTGPELTTDYEVYDACNPVATVTVLQRSNYPMFVQEEIRQLEKDYFSYQAEYKAIFKDPGFNGEWVDYTDSPVYDYYYLKFQEPVHPEWGNQAAQDEAVMIYVPSGQGTAIEAILTAAIGVPTNWTTTLPTTTTTTTTSTTSTTSTTTLVP
jgi:hypothetical protein